MTRRAVAWMLAGVMGAASCTVAPELDIGGVAPAGEAAEGTSGDPTAVTSQRAAASPSDREQIITGCQPWPDRAFEVFLRAYKSRDPDRIRKVIGTSEIVDPVALSYSGRSRFDEPVAWAEAGWEVDDRFELAGYSPMAPDHTWGGADGAATATMYALRRNETLAAAGIEAVGATFAVAIDGDCHVAGLEAVGEVWSQPQPCAFAAAFLDAAQREEFSPGCADGTKVAARSGHAAVTLDDRMILLGGTLGGYGGGSAVRYDGIVYDALERRWEPLPWPSTKVTGLQGVWRTDDGLLALGHTDEYEQQLQRWTPSRGWREMAAPPVDAPPATVGVWTGRDLVLWGGYRDVVNEGERPVIFDTATNRWRLGSPAPVGRRWDHTTVWTGQEVIAWGGGDARTDLGSGVAYDPAADRWRKIAEAPLSPRQWHTAVWTGREMIVFGGSSISAPQGDGAAYNPTTDRWRRLPPAPIGPRQWHTAVWTGDEMIVWGGTNYERDHNDGAAYDPLADRWRMLPEVALEGRCHHTASLVAGSMIVFGGTPGCGGPGHVAYGNGAAYDPSSGRWTQLPSPAS